MKEPMGGGLGECTCGLLKTALKVSALSQKDKKDRQTESGDLF